MERAQAAPLSLAERVQAAQQRQAESFRQEREAGPDRAQATEQTRQNQGPEIER